MHSGHFNAIRQAKSICDTLIVGIHSDPEIEENKALPVMKQNERYALLDHIKWIDEIVYDVPYSPLISTLEKARADFCIHGDDMPVNSEGVCAYDEMKLAGKLRIVKRTEGVSTTDIIGRLLTLQGSSCEHEEKSMLGKRLHPEDAIERLTSKQSPQVCPPLTAEEIDNLVAKYQMSPVDAASLRESLGSVSSSVESPPTADDVVRTKAPVQLLASTRRLVEFASSKQPSDGDRLVYVSGSFDMFHVGHAQFLKDAKALGSFLLVGIQDDATVKRSKGSSFPVMNLTERVLNVCALSAKAPATRKIKT
jgi:ethanolamine-phosphate cytidylyltransferase